MLQVWEFDAARMVAEDQSGAVRAETGQSEARQRQGGMEEAWSRDKSRDLLRVKYQLAN